MGHVLPARNAQLQPSNRVVQVQTSYQTKRGCIEKIYRHLLTYSSLVADPNDMSGPIRTIDVAHLEDEAETHTRTISPSHNAVTPALTTNGISEFPPLPKPSHNESKPVHLTAIIARKTSTSNGKSFAALLGGGRKPSSPSSSSPSEVSPRPSTASASSGGRGAALVHARPELAELAKYLEKKSNAEILQYCLGLCEFEDAPPIAERIVVICFDTEGWTADSAKITEVGFNTFDTRDMRKMRPGPHGENFMKQIYFYHIRVQPNAHLLNIKYCPGDPTANRFGQTRFLTNSETQGCLDDAFGWLLETGKPELGLCPVIMLGHALGGDLDKLQNTLGWNPQSLGNIVKVLDTQQIIRDVGWWEKRDQIGLPAIVARCSFTYRNAHTASNDAAMTTIAAIQMVLPNSKAWKEADQTKPLQAVIDEVEARSQKHNWTWGSPKFCLRCGSRTHMQEDLDIDGLPCRAPVRCSHCIAEGRHSASFSHVTERCIQYALAHGNSALAKKTNEEKAAKKAKYRRPFNNGIDAKPAIVGTQYVLGTRVVSEPPPVPYGPGGLFGPPLKSTEGKLAGPHLNTSSPFGSKLPGPFGNKPLGLIGRTQSVVLDKGDEVNENFSEHVSTSLPEVGAKVEICKEAGGELPETTNKTADSDHESSDSDATLIGTATIVK
jgi:hypothetical protein